MASGQRSVDKTRGHGLNHSLVADAWNRLDIFCRKRIDCFSAVWAGGQAVVPPEGFAAGRAGPALLLLVSGFGIAFRFDALAILAASLAMNGFLVMLFQLFARFKLGTEATVLKFLFHRAGTNDAR